MKWGFGNLLQDTHGLTLIVEIPSYCCLIEALMDAVPKLFLKLKLDENWLS